MVYETVLLLLLKNTILSFFLEKGYGYIKRERKLFQIRFIKKIGNGIHEALRGVSFAREEKKKLIIQKKNPPFFAERYVPGWRIDLSSVNKVLFFFILFFSSACVRR